ncbi:response regulator [Rhizobium sp. Root708]|uniref:response regulator n=1 Tax=Rhizobium sp. Root708 TaxID=1736592 RepID=UPI0009EB9890|nr:response regulator [Rhizobium sp. Root708]
MSFNVLIVEDQPLVALNLQDTVEELGHHAVGIASNMYQALLLADHVDMALVDVNLEGGPTGPIVGRTLAEADVTVLFMTSDPGALRGGVPGALGVLQKPVLDLELIEAIQFAADRRAGRTDIHPPRGLLEFPQDVPGANGTPPLGFSS